MSEIKAIEFGVLSVITGTLLATASGASLFFWTLGYVDMGPYFIGLITGVLFGAFFICFASWRYMERT